MAVQRFWSRLAQTIWLPRLLGPAPSAPCLKPQSSDLQTQKPFSPTSSPKPKPADPHPCARVQDWWWFEGTGLARGTPFLHLAGAVIRSQSPIMQLRPKGFGFRIGRCDHHFCRFAGCFTLSSSANNVTLYTYYDYCDYHGNHCNYYGNGCDDRD